MGKTIKQVAAELNVSKQAVWQRVKRSEELSAMLSDHSENVNGTIYVDTDLEQRIKDMYPDRPDTTDVDETPDNISETVDETTVNVDETFINSRRKVDETGGDVDVNTLIVTLRNTVDTLQQQLTVKDEQLAAKDKQLADLTAALVSAQEQHKALTDALTAAQALHAGTIQERLTVAEQPSADEVTVPVGEAPSEQQTKKRGFFARIFGKG